MADKGGNVVLMDTPHYVSMCQRILNIKNWYKKVNSDFVTESNEDFLVMVDHSIRGPLVRISENISELLIRLF